MNPIAIAALECLLLSAFVCPAASGQDTVSPRFEVASVKRVGAKADFSDATMSGGPGTPDPAKITWVQPLSRLLVVAYGIDFDQIAGPGLLGSEFYSIVANVAPGTTKEQVSLMWRNLLAERFHLKAHLVKRDFPAYELSVAKSGAKLRKSGDSPYIPEAGFPVPPPGVKWAISAAPPRNIHLTFRDYSMEEFAQRVGWPLGAMRVSGGYTPGRVVNLTRLAGTYDFTLEFAGLWGPGGAFPPQLPDGQSDTAPGLFDALRIQLGLRLEQKKIPVDVLVVDSVDRVPVET